MSKSTSTNATTTVEKKIGKKLIPKGVKKKLVNTLQKKGKKESQTTFKYTDKSPGQPKLVPIFEALKALLLPYEKGEMKVHGGTGGTISLINHRPLVIDGRKKPAMWFAGAMVQKGFVGFYFMCVYMNEPLKKRINPELLKCLKGKACFHIKKDDPVIYGQIEEALKMGFADFRKRGWV